MCSVSTSISEPGILDQPHFLNLGGLVNSALVRSTSSVFFISISQLLWFYTSSQPSLVLSAISSFVPAERQKLIDTLQH